MKKIISTSLILVVILTGILANVTDTLAFAPTLSVYSTGNGDSVQVTVNGDPNSNVVLYYQTSGNYSNQSQYLGTTNYNGYLSAMVTASSYSISSGSSVYVTVNGQQSSSVIWPYTNYYGGTGNSISLSQNSISVTVGQTSTITISGGYAPYSMYPNSPNLYQVALGGNTLTVIGQNTGSDTLRICSTGSTTSCASLYITINSGSNYYGSSIYLNQNSISLSTGSSAVISITGNGGYYVSSNSNSGIATTSISGNTLNIYGVTTGSTNISVCQNGGQCVTLYVTVNNGYNYGSTNSALTFSQNNLSLAIGQTMTVYVYGGTSSTYNVAYNSNLNTAQSSLSGSTLTISGLANGAVTIAVCSTANNCSALNVTVGTIGSILGTQNNWTFCASENGYCNFYGTQLVRYGANGSYVYRTVTGGTSCSNAVFGDPIFGTAKQCSYGGTR
jgi:hypothetical protein